jgi:hypothetical protein
MLWFINMLSRNRKFPLLSQTRSRINNNGSENEDLLLTITKCREERHYSMCLEDPVTFLFYNISNIHDRTPNLFRWLRYQRVVSLETQVGVTSQINKRANTDPWVGISCLGGVSIPCRPVKPTMSPVP